MAGAYIEINPQDTYTLTSNVLLNGVAQELYLSTIWFSAAQSELDTITPTLFINLSSLTGNIAISNNGTNINSVITVTLTSALTANCNYVNYAMWSLVAKTPGGSVYTLDRGRIAVVPRYASVSYQ